MPLVMVDDKSVLPEQFHIVGLRDSFKVRQFRLNLAVPIVVQSSIFGSKSSPNSGPLVDMT
jgi:hypothetical protein